MGVSYSFGLLKPDCLSRNIESEVLRMIESIGLEIVRWRRIRLTPEQVGIIWAPCQRESYYPEMVRFSTESDSLVFLVRGENAITRLNDLVGHWNPEIAAEGTIRKKYGTCPMRNVIHSTSNEETFRMEASLFFGQLP